MKRFLVCMLFGMLLGGCGSLPSPDMPSSSTPVPLSPAPLIPAEIQAEISSWTQVNWDYNYAEGGAAGARRTFNLTKLYDPTITWYISVSTLYNRLTEAKNGWEAEEKIAGTHHFNDEEGVVLYTLDDPGDASGSRYQIFWDPTKWRVAGDINVHPVPTPSP